MYNGVGTWTTQELEDLADDPIIRTWHVIYVQRPFESSEDSALNYARRIGETIELQNLAMEFHNVPQRITKGNVYVKDSSFYHEVKSSCSESLEQCTLWANELGREEGSWDLWMCSVPPTWRPDCGGLAYQPGDVSIMGEYCWYDSKFGCNGILHEMGHNFMAEHHTDFCYPEMQGVSSEFGWVTLMGGGAACTYTEQQKIFVYTDGAKEYCEGDKCVSLGNDIYDNASRMRYSLHVLLQGPIPDCPGADGRQVCIGMKNKFCSVNWVIGHFYSPADCAAHIMETQSCGSKIFGYAVDTWGCRCCTHGYDDPDLHDHVYWVLYEARSGTLAPSESPVLGPPSLFPTRFVSTMPTPDPTSTPVSISLVSSQTSCTYGATVPGDSLMECAQYIRDNPRVCPNSLFADATPDWNCRCCVNDHQGDFEYHEWWSIYNLNDESGNSWSLDFSPQDGHCPDGYALAHGQIADDIVDCGGSLSYWSCILSKPDAEKLCNMITCEVVSETSTISWLSSYPNAVLIGLRSSMKSDSEWKSCVKSASTTTTTSTEKPSPNPTVIPTALPTTISTEKISTQSPTDMPVTSTPTSAPTIVHKPPSKHPASGSPTVSPTFAPTTDAPSFMPTTGSPTLLPSTSKPSKNPTPSPTTSPVENFEVEFTFTSLLSCDMTQAIASHNYYLQLSEIYFYDGDQNRISYTSFVVSDSDSPGSEKPEKVADGNTLTKWLDRSFSCEGPGVVGVASGFSQIPVYYTFVTGNDSPPRDPNSWQVRICRDDVCDSPLNVQDQIPPSGRRTEYSTLYDFLPVSSEPSFIPSTSPTVKPLTTSPSTSRPSRRPSPQPFTSRPTHRPTTKPSNSLPSNIPSFHPTTSKPSGNPTVSPTNLPISTKPTLQPSDAPIHSQPTDMPFTSSPSKSPFTSSPTPMAIVSTPTGYPSATNPGDCGGMNVEKTNECLKARIYWLERELEDTREECASDRQYCEDTKVEIINILASQR